MIVCDHLFFSKHFQSANNFLISNNPYLVEFYLYTNANAVICLADPLKTLNTI